MNNYTKGEWIAQKGWVTWDKGDIQMIQDSKGLLNIAYVPSGTNCEANAQLIASSPRMAELLKRLVDNGWNAGISEEAKEILNTIS